MQRFNVLFSASLLAIFISLIALKVNSDLLEQAVVNIEEVDIEDSQDVETEEIEFQLKDFNLSSDKTFATTIDASLLAFYHFAIKSNSRKVHSPPPEV